jgi:hypothetical protein
MDAGLDQVFYLHNGHALPSCQQALLGGPAVNTHPATACREPLIARWVEESQHSKPDAKGQTVFGVFAPVIKALGIRANA